MFCPKCKAEFREGFTSCADCNVNLVEDLPEFEEESIEEPFVIEEYETPGQKVRFCPECQEIFDDDLEECPDCEIELETATKDNRPEMVKKIEAQILHFQERIANLQNLKEIEEEKVLLFETDDMNFAISAMEALDKNGLEFEFLEAENSFNPLGFLLSSNSPTEEKLNRVLVRLKDEKAATDFLNQAPELGLNEIPEELANPSYDEEGEEPEDEY
jgi:hypothetical protein